MDQMYWRCDPNTPVEGLTYIQLTKLLQAIPNTEWIIEILHEKYVNLCL